MAADPQDIECSGGDKICLKPNLNFEQAVDLIKKLYGYEDVVCLKEFCSYDNQNFLIEARCPTGSSDGGGDPAGSRAKEKYVLKLTNSDDSELFDLHAEQNRVLHHINAKGIQCPSPVKNLMGGDLSLESLSFKQKAGEQASGLFLTRLMKFIPGDPIGSAERITGKMCFETGQLLGKLTRALGEYEGDMSLFVERGDNYLWSLKRVPAIREHLGVVTDGSDRKLVEEIVTAFETKVLHNADKLRKGFIHNDFNDFNVLVSKGNGGIVGLLDFDDISHSYIAFDIGIAIMYMMQCGNLERYPLDSGGLLLAGYLTECTLNGAEWAALYYCIAARFAQSLTLGLYYFSLQPQNDYLLSTQVRGWQATRDLWGQDVNALYSQWQKLADECRQLFGQN